MTIDFHTHCFPDALAPKALGGLSLKANIVPATDGTVSGSIECLERAGIDFGVVCSIATNARQLSNVNSFAIDINDFSKRLIALGSAHPESPILESELDRLYDHDIKGIKIHPEYTPYYIDSPEWDRVFSLCEERRMFIVTHAGFDYISPDRIAATPDRIAKVLEKHKDLTLIAAHLGGNLCWEQVKSCLCGRSNLYFDTALLKCQGADPSLVAEIIRLHGASKILFGSDMPWSDPKEELNFVRSLELSDKDEQMILGENAERLLFS